MPSRARTTWPALRPRRPRSAARLSLYGLLIDGPVGHAWYALLDRHVCPEAPTSNKAVLIKVGGCLRVG